MRFATLLIAGTQSLAVEHESRWIDVASLGVGIPDVEALAAADLDGLDRIRRALKRAPSAAGIELSPGILGPAVPRPGKIVAVGLNYRAHAEETGSKLPARPLLFAKFPSAVLAPDGVISWDPSMTSQVDYEAELGVVIGRRARSVSSADALDHVLGYTCVNDVSARDLQVEDGQWVRAKSLDTFCPLGPFLVTRDDIPDPQALRITCHVNGNVRQAASTADMYFGVRELVAFCSSAFTLEPGDVIATGTPSGIGLSLTPPQFLGSGDEVVVEIEGIGRLANTCRPLKLDA